MKCDSGTLTPVIPSAVMRVTAGALKRSSQTTSLASSRSACSASRAASFELSFDVAVRVNVAASPSMPLTRNCSASIRCEFSSRSRPGARRRCAAWTFWRS